MRDDGCVNSMGGILSQCVHVSDHHVVHFKYLTILFVNYTLIKIQSQKVKVVKLMHQGFKKTPKDNKVH